MSAEALSRGALALALVAGGLAVWALNRPNPAPQPCDCKAQIAGARRLPSRRAGTDELAGAAAEVPPPPDLRGEVAALREQVARLEARAIQADSGREPDEARAQAAPPSEGRPAEAPQRFVRFEIPSPALRVEQAENGTLAVFNTDPALTGQILRVQAWSADGTSTPLTLTVPAP